MIKCDVTAIIVNITFLYLGVEHKAQNVYLNYCHLAIKDTQTFEGNLILPKSLINIPWNKNSMLPTIVILSTKISSWHVLFGQRQEHNRSTLLTKHCEVSLIQSSLPISRKIKTIINEPKENPFKTTQKIYLQDIRNYPNSIILLCFLKITSIH